MKARYRSVSYFGGAELPQGHVRVVAVIDPTHIGAVEEAQRALNRAYREIMNELGHLNES